jgi:hypothetical protein
VAPPGNQAANGENKPQSAVFGKTGLLDASLMMRERVRKSPLLHLFTITFDDSLLGSLTLLSSRNIRIRIQGDPSRNYPLFKEVRR